MNDPHRGRKVLAARLSEMMRNHVQFNNQKRLEAGSGIGQPTIGRILHAEVAVRVDTIQQLADALGRDMGEFLREDPSHGGIDYERDRYARLPPYEQARVEAFIKSVIAEHEYKEAREAVSDATRAAAQQQAEAEPRRVRLTDPKPGVVKTTPARPATRKRAAK